MKKTITGIAVATAACLTIAPLLSATPASAATRLDNHFSRLILLDTQATKDEYVAIDSDLHGERFDELADAEAAAGADFFDLPRLSTAGNSISNLETGEGLKANASNGTISYSSDSILDPALQWDIDGEGHVESHVGGYLALSDTSGQVSLSTTSRYVVTGSSTGASPTKVVAKASTFDANKGEALITGSAASSAFGDVRIEWPGGNFTTTQANGTFVALVSGLTAGQKSVTLTQSVDGTKYDSVVVPLESGAGTTEPFAMTSPKVGDTYSPNSLATFAGTGKPGETVTIHSTKFASPDVTGKVGSDGKWSIPRSMGGGTYTFDITQSNDTASAIRGFVFAPTTAAKAFVMTSPVAGDTFDAGTTAIFRGDGKPGETVTIHSTKFASPDVTGKVDSEGHWSIPRGLGSGAYTFDITQSNDTAGAIRGFVYAPKSVAKPFVMTSPSVGDKFQPNRTTFFRGTGTAGETVTIHSTKFASPDVTGKIDSQGNWSIPRSMGGGTYTFDITQSNDSAGAIRGFVYAPSTSK